MKYPKPYATINRIYREPNPDWSLPELALAYGKDMWEFITEAGEVIVQHNPGRSGHTPNRLKSRWYQVCKELGYNNVDSLTLATTCYKGVRVKLYQRHESTRWYFRHMGQ